MKSNGKWLQKHEYRIQETEDRRICDLRFTIVIDFAIGPFLEVQRK